MYMNTMIALAANTPGAEGSLFEWAWFIFNKYSTLFLKATWVTLYVALIGTLLGFILGFAVGIINTVKIHKEDNIVKKILLHILKAIVVVYVEIFRDTPMIVQGMVIYYGLRQNDIMITSIIAGILVTTLNTGAYMGETVRAGIKSVDAGQEEGALAMGMSHFKAMADIFTSHFIYADYFKERKNIIVQIAGIIHNKKGCVTISDIAVQTGYNQRYLDRVFKESLGVSMKKYAGIIRIQKAIYYLQNNLTYEIYERLGYYDQAHFIKDFKKNTSLTPNKFGKVNSELNIV